MKIYDPSISTNTITVDDVIIKQIVNYYIYDVKTHTITFGTEYRDIDFDMDDEMKEWENAAITDLLAYQK